MKTFDLRGCVRKRRLNARSLGAHAKKAWMARPMRHKVCQLDNTCQQTRRYVTSNDTTMLHREGIEQSQLGGNMLLAAWTICRQLHLKREVSIIPLNDHDNLNPA
jgi:hypothetical protein